MRVSTPRRSPYPLFPVPLPLFPPWLEEVAGAGVARSGGAALRCLQRLQRLHERRGGGEGPIHQPWSEGIEEVDRLRVEREHDLRLRPARVVDDYLRELAGRVLGKLRH